MKVYNICVRSQPLHCVWLGWKKRMEKRVREIEEKREMGCPYDLGILNEMKIKRNRELLGSNDLGFM